MFTLGNDLTVNTEIYHDIVIDLLNNRSRKSSGVTGVYAIVNTENKKMYVGSANNIATRLSNHRHFLKGLSKEGLRHKNKHLQKDWDVYGEGAFDYIVIVECNRDELVDLEQEWILKLGLDNLYNVTDAYRVLDTMPDEMRESISKARKGLIFTDEHRQALSDSHMGKPWSAARRAAHKPGVQDKSLSFEKAQEIRRLYELGASYKELAAKYNVGQRSIYDVLRNLYYHDPGYTSKIKPRKVISEDVKANIIRDVLNLDIRVSEVARKYNVSNHTVYKYINQSEKGE